MHKFIISLLGGMVGAVIVIGIYHQFIEKKTNPIADYYNIENAVMVSPHGLRKDIVAWKTDFIIVDLRSAEEYEVEHIKWAINIPAYKDKDHSAYDQVDRIVGSFAALPKDKTIIVYCYSHACMTGRKVGKMLSDKGIFVKHLGIGWNEWRYDWKSWNHPHEWETTNPMDYIDGKNIVHTGSSMPLITPCDKDGLTGC